VDQWKDKGAVDIAQELAWPLPFDVFFNLLGLPSVHDEKFAQLEKWTHQLKHREPNSPELTPISKAAAANIRDYFKELIEDRRKNPSDDLLTHIVNAEIEGKPFVQGEVTEDSEVLGLLTLLFLGGVESTAGLIGSVFKLLGENPDQRALVLADPSRVSDAIEETLRWSSPLQETARTAIRDVELHGTTIPAGSRVVLVTGAANRDDRQFENPDKFDISRGKFRHFGFGEGLHRCLGAPLARLEASIVLEEVLPLLGEYELSEPATFYPSSPNMYVWKNVPIRFNVA
jgi:cytochrome P450